MAMNMQVLGPRRIHVEEAMLLVLCPPRDQSLAVTIRDLLVKVISNPFRKQLKPHRCLNQVPCPGCS